MKRELQKILNKLPAFELIELGHAVNVALLARKFCHDNGITTSKLAQEMNCSVSSAQKFLNGTHVYDMRTISQFDAFVQDTKAEHNSILKMSPDANSKS